MSGTSLEEFSDGIRKLKETLASLDFSFDDLKHTTEQIQKFGDAVNNMREWSQPQTLRGGELNGLLDLGYIIKYVDLDTPKDSIYKCVFLIEKPGRPDVRLISYDSLEAEEIMDIHMDSNKRLDYKEYPSTMMQFS